MPTNPTPQHIDHYIPVGSLPWDNGQFRKSDIGFGIFALADDDIDAVLFLVERLAGALHAVADDRNDLFLQD